MAELDRKPRNHIVGIAILRVRMEAMGRVLPVILLENLQARTSGIWIFNT